MSERRDEEMLAVLREIRDGQRQVLQAMAEQRALAERQLENSRRVVDESVGLQRQALARQRSITLIAVPGILFCIGAILYLVFRYF